MPTWRCSPPTCTDRRRVAANATPREGAFNVNGMRSTYNNFLLDGIDNNAYSTSNQGFSNQVAQPSPDAVAEFKVITSNFSAEYGRVGGAVVNVVMRSGTNQFHGTRLRVPAQHQAERHRLHFRQRPATFQKPTLQRNQFGGTIGGPIVKNKIFFFGDYEGFRQLQKVPQLRFAPESDGPRRHSAGPGGQSADRRGIPGRTRRSP